MDINFLKDKKYIDLRPYFRSHGIDQENIHIGYDGALELNGEPYYIKLPDTAERLYSELIAAKLLSKLNLPHVEYRLAKYFDKTALLSKSFKDPSCNYVSGQRILDDFADTLEEPMDTGDLNNLEHIWQALEYRYLQKYSPDQTLTIVSSLMDEITTLFSFDLVIGNLDRHQSNWVIEEGPNGIHLAKIFDNEYLLDGYLDPESIFSYAMAVDYDQLAHFASPREVIVNYVNISSEEFINKLQTIKNKLSLLVFIQTIKEVENDIGSPIPSKTKLKMVSSYQKQQKLITKVIEKYYSHQFSK